MNKILQLFKMQQSVFNFADLESIFCTDNKQVLKNKIQFLKKKGVLLSPRRGIYILEGKAINHFELANKIYCPSYISFFSALYHHQVIFQYPDEVYLAYKKTQMQNI
jgi:predicted transcriptional regulator of viral defense system